MKRLKVQRKRLDELELEFQTLLPACLRTCSEGRWGLFGQNDRLDPDLPYLNWPEARRSKELAREINSTRREFGQPNQTCERFFHSCSLRGANVPGEPKLAAALLAEIAR